MINHRPFINQSIDYSSINQSYQSTCKNGRSHMNQFLASYETFLVSFLVRNRLASSTSSKNWKTKMGGVHVWEFLLYKFQLPNCTPDCMTLCFSAVHQWTFMTPPPTILIRINNYNLSYLWENSRVLTSAWSNRFQPQLSNSDTLTNTCLGRLRERCKNNLISTSSVFFFFKKKKKKKL